MSVNDLVAKRMEVQRQILINPADVEAHKALNYIEQQVGIECTHRCGVRYKTKLNLAV